jgi:Effector-associated domain 1
VPTRRETALYTAMRDAYIDRADLEILVFLCADKSLDDIAAPVLPLKTVIFRLVWAAKSEGWLDSLADAVIEDRPDNKLIQDWTRHYRAGETGDHDPPARDLFVPDRPRIEPQAGRQRPEETAAPGPPAGLALLDSVYFDLNEMRKAIMRARTGAPSRVLGFGVSYSEFVFVNKLCDWLVSFMGAGTQRKDPMNLRPELAPVSRRLRQVARYRQDLESANVLCVVLVDTVPPDSVSEFWKMICLDFAEIERYLVLVFVGDGSTGFPPGVAVLPPPRFDLEDVALWAGEMLSRRGWPVSLADAWTKLLCDAALYDGELSVAVLYEAMDRSIQEFRFRPERFRVMLEKGIGYADPA